MSRIEKEAEKINNNGFANTVIEPPTKLQQIKDNLVVSGRRLVGRWSVLDVLALGVPAAASYIFLSHFEPFKSQPTVNLAISSILGVAAYYTILDAVDVFIDELRKDHNHL